MPEPRSGRPRRPVLCTLAVLAATGGVVAIARSPEAFWICVPAALLLSTWARTLPGVLLTSAAAIGVAAAPGLASAHFRPMPSAPLAVLIPAACVAILQLQRERADRERDALRAFALTDPLTGAANRRSLLARLDYEIARHNRSGRTFGVIMLDLDGFKLLNDRFGHPTGDDLLRDVAAAIRHAVRDQDTVARLGGDEFCVLAPETDDRGTRRLAARAADAVQRAATGVDTLGASAGAAQFPDDGSTAQAVLDAADQRLLDAKRQRTHQRRRAA
ncbi:MAG TPA: GGDEF domain-containing protein [Solirubrobacteraceae bacterium]